MVVTDAGQTPPAPVPVPSSPLQDPLVLDEIELYGELVIAASGSEEPLSQDRIDTVLGVGPDRPLA